MKSLLAADPANEEYTELAAGLEELLALTRDLLADAAPEALAPVRKRKSRWDTAEESAVPAPAPAPAPVDAAPPPPPPPSDAHYRPVAAPKRAATTAATADAPSATILDAELPKAMRPAPGDDAKTRERKAKAAKAFKSKQRFARMDAASAHKAASWQAFSGGGGGGEKKKNALPGLRKAVAPATAPPPAPAAAATFVPVKKGGQ